MGSYSGNIAYCIEPGTGQSTGDSLTEKDENYFNNIKPNGTISGDDIRLLIGRILQYGYRGGISTSWKSQNESDANCIAHAYATQILIWETIVGERDASFNHKSPGSYDAVLDCVSPSHPLRSKILSYYNSIVTSVQNHTKVPSFCTRSSGSASVYELKWDGSKYVTTLTDANGVLGNYNFSANIDGVTFSTSGNKLTVSMDKAPSKEFTITATKKNGVRRGVVVWSDGINQSGVGIQDVVTYAQEVSDPVSGFLKMKVSYGSCQIVKTSEDGNVDGIQFTISGNGINQTVTTANGGKFQLDNLMPGVYTVTEQSIDKYVPQEVHRVTVVAGQVAKVNFNNVLKRGDLQVIKNSEDNLVEGVTFHLYGTSLSGIEVDEYAVTNKNGVASFNDVLISGATPYTIEEVDTDIRYVVPANQTAPINWEEVTTRNFVNILKKFSVTVTKSDSEEGTAQGNATLAGAVYGMELGAGSDIEYLSADEANELYLELVKNSVAYMVMARLGLDVDKAFTPDDFAGISNFNSQEVLNAVGIATSDIAEMALLPISKTIVTISKENRTFDRQAQTEYNKDTKNERSQSDERNHIHDGRRLQPSEPEIAGADGSNSGQMVADEKNLSEGTSQNPVLQSSDERNSEQSLGGNSTESDRAGGDFGEADGSQRRTDRADEVGRYDEVGSLDEQHQELGTGNREESGNIRLEYYDRTHEDKSLPFFGNDDTIREMLGITPHLTASKEEIKNFYEANSDNAARTEFIKGIFNNDFTQLTLNDGRLVGYKTFQNVLHLWAGEYENRTAQSFYDWGVIAQHFEAMRLLGELTDTMKPLPSMDGQLTLITDGRTEEQKTSVFSFSQEIIDAVLTRGSGISEGKMRIYEQFEKSLSAKENAEFLKNEYGWGGSYPVIIGAGIDEQHDGKGITISKGIGSDKPHITLSWSQVEKRIGELIRMDRYLNTKEKENYPQWLEKQEQRRAELAEQRQNRDILSTSPPNPVEKTEDLAVQQGLWTL